jgi:hypothetical protein
LKVEPPTEFNDIVAKNEEDEEAAAENESIPVDSEERYGSGLIRYTVHLLPPHGVLVDKH